MVPGLGAHRSRPIGPHVRGARCRLTGQELPMPRRTPSPPPAPQVRLMFEPSHLAPGCLAAAYARLVPRRPVGRPAAPQPVRTAREPSAPSCTPALSGGTSS